MRNHTIEILSRKTLRLSVFAILLVFGVSSCTRNVYVVKKMPPGHVKKITGSKSAKPYAPGQVKKKVKKH